MKNKENILFKLLCSLPIILIVLYYIPFLGVCLILFRYYIYRNDNPYKTPILLLITGIILLIPKLLDNLEIIHLNDIIDAGIYVKISSYSKLLITLGIIFLILSYILKRIIDSLANKVKKYMEEDLKKDYEIRKENDLKMQEKRERAKNTHVVHCPYCGSDNMLTEQTGTCKFCRRKIEYK